jgi:hypothetical protein
VENILEQLRPIGFSHSTVERCFVRLLKPSIALCCIDGTRRRAAGSSIARIDATYVLTAHPTGGFGNLLRQIPKTSVRHHRIAAGNAIHRRQEL